jgi:hypothetical protein
MSDPLHQQLLGHLLGALDDDEQQNLDVRLDSDATCRRELLRWRRRLAPLEAIRPDFEPPPDLAARTCCYVSASAPPGIPSDEQRLKMSQFPLPPNGAPWLKWTDAAFVMLVLFICLALIPPAIYASRFQTRLASCQDALRRFGLAMTEYGYRQNTQAEQLAADGQLTSAGAFAAELIKSDYLANSHDTCPDAWLAIQNVQWNGQNQRVMAQPAVFWQNARLANVSYNRRSPGESPLLSDYPTTPCSYRDEPVYQESPTPVHDGLGRNLFFANGRVAFQPSNSRP